MPAKGPQVALVTGCTAGGIGHALALELHAKGCIVYASARKPEGIAPVPAEAASSERWKTVALDVTSEASIKSAVDTVLKEQGRIDILVNNAGISNTLPIAEVSLDAVRAVYNTNVFGTIACCQAVIPAMAQAQCGTIVNFGSVVGLIPTPWAGLYCSSKAAVHSLSDALRMELRPFGINVMVLAPGAIKSNFGTNTLEKLGTSNLKLYKPYEAAIRARADASQNPSSTPTLEFARSVVPQIMSPTPPAFLLAGAWSTYFWLLSCMPRWLTRYLTIRKFGLDKPVPTEPGTKERQLKAGTKKHN